MKTIDSVTYEKKCEAEVFKCLTYKSDSLEIHKILHKFSFGKISTQEALQLRLLLSKRANKEVDTNASLIITYLDTLYGYESRVKLVKQHFNMSESQNLSNGHYLYSKKKFENWLKVNQKRRKRCTNRTEKKFNARIFNTYNYDDGFLMDFQQHLIKDNGILKNKFFKVINNYYLLIVKPSGDYFLGGSHLSDDHLKKVITSEDWSEFKSDLKNSESPNNKSGLGIFEKHTGFHVKHCF